MTLSAIAITFIALASLLRGQEQSAETLVAKAILNPNNASATSAIGAMSKQFDPRLTEQFLELFRVLPEKNLRQSLAMVMLRNGVNEQSYFDELARYAREAVTSTAPYPFKQDERGKDIRSADGKSFEWDPAFTAWCEARAIEKWKCFYTVVDYPLDVMKLFGSGDRRAIPILRDGLRARLALTVKMSVAALARFNDTESIPQIADSIQRFPPVYAELIAQELQEFDDPRVEPLLDRYITNPKMRQEIRDAMWHRRIQHRK